MLGRESLVLAAREVIVLVILVGVILWLAYHLTRARRDG